MIEPLTCFPENRIRNLKGVFFDIDDTFSTSGKILPSAYNALWMLREAGIAAVPITGRPAGWCDHIARMWPIDAVVGENGAFYFRVDEKRRVFVKRFVDDDDIRRDKRKRLEMIRDEVLARVPGTAVASDQNYREADLAIDFCEDVPRLEWSAIDEICEIFRKHGATCKVSSIHVNGWFGDYSKLQMTCQLVRELWGLDLEGERDRFVYIGDSPNDEPMFSFFPHSVGVRNVLDFVDRMTSLPAYVTEGRGGDGFAELVHRIVGAQI